MHEHVKPIASVLLNMEEDLKQEFETRIVETGTLAYRVAFSILRNPEDAEDVAQEAMLRAVRFFAGFRGGDARAWFLQIVRNCGYSWIEKHRPMELSTEFDEETHWPEQKTPETVAAQADMRQQLTKAIEALPPRSREVLVLREIEDCSYKEIAEITGIPLGTVMSTLSRARERLQRVLAGSVAKEASHGL